jgi:hypothetical protein
VNAWLRPDKTNKPAVCSDYERRPQISKPLNALTSFPAAQARISLIILTGPPSFLCRVRSSALLISPRQAAFGKGDSDEQDRKR